MVGFVWQEINEWLTMFAGSVYPTASSSHLPDSILLPIANFLLVISNLCPSVVRQIDQRTGPGYNDLRQYVPLTLTFVPVLR